jgi:hypothetical protein
VPEISFGKRRVAPAPRSRDAEPISLDDLDVSLDELDITAPGEAARSNPRPSTPAPAGEAQVLDGGFVRSGKPISVLPGDPSPVTRRSHDLSLAELASDVEPVSLHDLGMVLGPAAAPPAWSGAPKPASSLKPRPHLASTASAKAKPEAAPSHEHAADAGRTAQDHRDAEARAAARQKRTAAKERLAAAKDQASFFKVDTASPGIEVPVELESEPPPSSGRADLMSLLAPPSDRPQRRAAEALAALDGNLFGSIPRAAPLPSIDVAPLDVAPVVTAPPVSIAPVIAPDRVPPSRRRPAPSETEVVEARVVSKSTAPGPVVSERGTASRKGGLAGWILGAAAAGAVTAIVALRFEASPPQEEVREAAVTSAPSQQPAVEHRRADAVEAPAPARTEEPAAPKPVAATSRPVEPARVVEPARPVEPLQQKERAAPPPVNPAVIAQPPPATPAPPPAAPSPPAGGGGEFDKGAAKAALAAAASMAAACKQPDDPSGGARVSVTFSPSGRVTTAKLVSGAFMGTPTGSCIARAFRTISVPAFSGDPVTVTKEVAVR